VQLPEHFCYEHPHTILARGVAESSVTVGKVADVAEIKLKTPKELAAELREAAKAFNAALLHAAQAGLTVDISQQVVSPVAALPQRKRVTLTITQAL
jgi:hypothetical protein